MAKWQCYFSDNGGKQQYFTVRAKDKTEAVNKAFARAKKHAKGDLYGTWKVNLISAK